MKIVRDMKEQRKWWHRWKQKPQAPRYTSNHEMIMKLISRFTHSSFLQEIQIPRVQMF